MLPLPSAVESNTCIVVLRCIWTVFIPIKGALAGGMMGQVQYQCTCGLLYGVGDVYGITI